MPKLANAIDFLTSFREKSTFTSEVDKALDFGENTSETLRKTCFYFNICNKFQSPPLSLETFVPNKRLKCNICHLGPDITLTESIQITFA